MFLCCKELSLLYPAESGRWNTEHGSWKTELESTFLFAPVPSISKFWKMCQYKRWADYHIWGILAQTIQYTHSIPNGHTTSGYMVDSRCYWNWSHQYNFRDYILLTNFIKGNISIMYFLGYNWLFYPDNELDNISLNS